MYKYIINPKTNKKVNINTKLGRKIINNYLFILTLKGGVIDGKYKFQIGQQVIINLLNSNHSDIGIIKSINPVKAFLFNEEAKKENFREIITKNTNQGYITNIVKFYVPENYIIYKNLYEKNLYEKKWKNIFYKNQKVIVRISKNYYWQLGIVQFVTDSEISIEKIHLINRENKDIFPKTLLNWNEITSFENINKYINWSLDKHLSHSRMKYDSLCEPKEILYNMKNRWDQISLPSWTEFYTNNPIYVIIAHGKTVIKDYNYITINKIPKDIQLISLTRSSQFAPMNTEADNDILSSAKNPSDPDKLLLKNDGITPNKIYRIYTSKDYMKKYNDLEHEPLFEWIRESEAYLYSCPKLYRENDNYNDINLNFNDPMVKYIGIYFFNNFKTFEEIKNNKILLSKKFNVKNKINVDQLNRILPNEQISMSQLFEILGKGTYIVNSCRGTDNYEIGRFNPIIRMISQQQIDFDDKKLVSSVDLTEKKKNVDSEFERIEENKKEILDKLEEQKNKLEEERINYERLLRLKAAEARALNF